MTKYAVMFEIEEGEWMYASAENPFSYNSMVRVFDTEQQATDHAKQWNTGRVVVYHAHNRTPVR